MTTFLEATTDFVTLSPDDSRRELWRAFETVGLPTTSDEVWRYAPLSSFSLEPYRVNSEPTSRDIPVELRPAVAVAGMVIRTHNGQLTDITGALTGVSVTSTVAGESRGGQSFAARYHDDAFALMSGALAPHTLDIDITNQVDVDRPIVIIHDVVSSSTFLNLRVSVGGGSRVNIMEFFVGGADALVVPLSEFFVAANGELRISTFQRLANSAWHVARTTAFLERDARVHQAIVGLGARYNRARNDAEFLGAGASNVLHTTFLGSGDQVHDFRTHQNHRVGRTNSTLLSKGAVAERSRSVYTGLIEIENGARRTDARQTNVNLLLSPDAHADTVPNLDIRENDVVCAHASSVGPLDELQIWYLESRGVPPEDAQRLLVQGFFNEMTVSLPQAVADLVASDVRDVIAKVGV